ncbi:unnamed protein product [Rhizophagus irregularis]|nr:unnamed protein product [Rhizophagus irregularis]
MNIKRLKSTKQVRKNSRWYKFLIALTNTRRLNFNLDDPIIQNPQITRPETPPTNDEPIHLQGRPKLIASWTPTITDMIYGKILTATHFPNTVPILYAEHWIHRNLDTSNHHNTPRSQTNTIISCQGCSLHYPYYVGS